MEGVNLFFKNPIEAGMQQSNLPFCQLWNKYTFDVMLIFFKIAILGADALCFLLGSQGMNEGAHNTRDLRRTERPIL